MTGSAANCNVACTFVPVTICDDDDFCCPAGCDAAIDNDCSPSCGNGVVEPGETCDGNCPTSCDDGNACTIDLHTGNAAKCSAACTLDVCDGLGACTHPTAPQGTSCGSGAQKCCGATCINLDTSHDNCGACGVACSSHAHCSYGHCYGG
jgi:hypothetical protein